MLNELLKKTRSYRSFDPNAEVSEELLLEFIDNARIAAATMNLQPLKYRLVTSREEMAKLLPLTRWAAVLGIKLSGESESPAIEVQPGYYEEPTEIFTMPEQTTSWWQSMFEEETEPATEASTAPAQSTTLAEKVTEITEIVTEVTTLIGAQISDVFKMPKAPKYIPPDTSINFDKASIASYKYDPDGNYYYTDDKNAWQSNFGFNEGYDSMAPLTMMVYDTVRTKFNYGGK